MIFSQFYFENSFFLSGKKKNLVFLFLIFIIAKGYSQNKETIDTASVKLNEVKVLGFSNSTYLNGLKIDKIDSASLANAKFYNLSDFLQFNSPVAIKSYGAGQLSTISFRGTSANHTSLLWNGININAPSLGQTDFSTVPLAAFDQISIQYGPSSSCIGSDAIGGAIFLSSSPQFSAKNISFSNAVQYGSFDNYQAQLAGRFKIKLSNKFILSSKTQAYGNFWNNHFPYEKRSDWQGNVYPMQKSQTYQMGLTQDIFLKSKSGNLFSLNIWLTDNKLTVNPEDSLAREITQNIAYRFLVNYDLKNVFFKTAYMRDVIKYGKGKFINPSTTITDKYILRGEYEWLSNKYINIVKVDFKTGFEGTHYVANVDGYVNNLILENRLDLYALSSFSIHKLFLSFNLRQAFSTFYKAPFTPSIGLKYYLFQSPQWAISLKGNISRSYRLPTLNERYWKDLGNPGIQPEDALNKEAGLDFMFNFDDSFLFKIGFAYYHNLIDNWAYWNPAKNYHVENLQQVLCKGLEINLLLKYTENKLSYGLNTMYALTNSSQQKVYDFYSQDIIGKQMIYVPKNTANAKLFLEIGNWFVNFQGLYNSERFVTFDHSGDPFPPYIIINGSLSKSFKTNNCNYNIKLQANNISNTTFPNVLKNAMPGASFNLSFTFNFFK